MGLWMCICSAGIKRTISVGEGSSAEVMCVCEHVPAVVVTQPCQFMMESIIDRPQ